MKFKAYARFFFTPLRLGEAATPASRPVQCGCDMIECQTKVSFVVLMEYDAMLSDADQTLFGFCFCVCVWMCLYVRSTKWSSCSGINCIAGNDLIVSSVTLPRASKFMVSMG